MHSLYCTRDQKCWPRIDESPSNICIELYVYIYIYMYTCVDGNPLSNVVCGFYDFPDGESLHSKTML